MIDLKKKSVIYAIVPIIAIVSVVVSFLSNELRLYAIAVLIVLSSVYLTKNKSGIITVICQYIAGAYFFLSGNYPLTVILVIVASVGAYWILRV